RVCGERLLVQCSPSAHQKLHSGE
ncbi:hypothetical protein DBR06_SOUSAS26110005, partial [Sousa chinensis]